MLVLHSGYAAEYKGEGDGGAPSYRDRIYSQGHSSSIGEFEYPSPFITSYSTTAGVSATISLDAYAIGSAWDFVCTETPATMSVMTHEWVHMFDALDLYASGGSGPTGNDNASSNDTLLVYGGLSSDCRVSTLWPVPEDPTARVFWRP